MEVVREEEESEVERGAAMARTIERIREGRRVMSEAGETMVDDSIGVGGVCRL